MRYLPRIPSVLLVLAALVGCTGEPEAPPPEAADPGARFVRFALALEAATGRQYDIDYWGPEEVQAEAAALGLSVEAVADSLEVLQASIDVASASGLEAERLEALAYRIGALRAWIDVLQGAEPGFEEEARRILGVRPRRFPVEELDPFVAALEEAFPGPGPLAPRVGARMAGLAVPEDRREAVFRRALAACRERTREHLELPEAEAIEVVFTDTVPSTAGYFYRGDYRGLMLVNPAAVNMQSVLHLACHEGYPGHHVYYVLREAHLGDRGWPELELGTLFEPSRVMVEGLADYAPELAFPEEEQLRLLREELLPLAGLDPDAAEAVVTVGRLFEDGIKRYQAFEVSRAYLDGASSLEEAMAFRTRYGFPPPSPQEVEGFRGYLDDFRTLPVAYPAGEEFVRARVHAVGPDPAARWAAFRELHVALATPELMAGAPEE
jgi:hypothetical protein